MRLNVRADKLLDELANMGIELDQASQQSYFDFWSSMGYPRSTVGVYSDADAERELNKWAKSTGQDIKFVDVNMTDYADKRAEHPEVKVDATAPVQEKITKRTSMADVIKDFYASDAPQFKGKSKAKRRQMAIAAKLSKMDEKSTASLRNQSYFDGLDRLKKLAKKANEAFESLYAQNKENALDSEVLVPGYGRMSYKGLQGHIADKFTELGKMLKDGDAGTVKKVQYLIKNDPMLSMLNSLETAFDELSAKRKRGGRGSRGIGSEFSEMSETIIDKIKRERFAEGEERSYICVHADKGKHECTATSSYGAAKKAAAHWGLKSTAGIDAHLAENIRQDIGEEWDKPIDKAQFQANEAENLHTENAVALARRFGTPEEFEKMMDVYEAHMERGWIEQDELEYRDSIIKKYYPMLEDAYNINSAILNPRGNDTCVCKHCGDKLHEPTTDCQYDSHDPNGSNWIIIRAEESEEDVYNSLAEAWSQEYKNSIDCNNPKGFSQKAYCKGKKKRNKG